MKLCFAAVFAINLAMFPLSLQAQDDGRKPATASPASGRDMYLTYCAACHGTDGKGSGPVASALKKPPADLTTLAAHNQGKFPQMRVYGAIRGDLNVPSHGTAEMPVWGRVLLRISQGDDAQAQLRIANLVGYLRSIQTK